MDLMPLGNVLFARMYRKTVTGKYLILGGGEDYDIPSWETSGVHFYSVDVSDEEKRLKVTPT